MAKLKRIDRGWDENSNLWIIFASRENGLLGHAMVLFAKRNGKIKTWENVEAFGAYPIEESVLPLAVSKLKIGAVPGKLAEETLASIHSISTALAVGVSKSKFDYVRSNTGVINQYPDDYNLLLKNCVHFVDMIAKALSLETGSTDFALPHDYLNDLLSRNN